MQSRIEALKAGVTAAQGSWWPQIFLTGNYYYSRPNSRILPTKDEFIHTWDLGVQLQFDVWNWFATKFQSDQAKAALRQNELMYGQMKDNVSLEVKRYDLAVSRAAEKIEVANLAIDQAEENARTTSDKFKNGLATSLDLLDADVALLQARTNYTGALVEYELARARLKRAIGAE
jgi:outer membrane protein